MFHSVIHWSVWRVSRSPDVQDGGGYAGLEAPEPYLPRLPGTLTQGEAVERTWGERWWDNPALREALRLLWLWRA